jgi:hypothetical protein
MNFSVAPSQRLCFNRWCPPSVSYSVYCTYLRLADVLIREDTQPTSSPLPSSFFLCLTEELVRKEEEAQHGKVVSYIFYLGLTDKLLR